MTYLNCQVKEFVFLLGINQFHLGGVLPVKPNKNLKFDAFPEALAGVVPGVFLELFDRCVHTTCNNAPIKCAP